MGKLFIFLIFDGEFIFINFFDRVQGTFVILLGLIFYFYLVTKYIGKCLEIYYIEIGYLN